MIENPVTCLAGFFLCLFLFENCENPDSELYYIRLQIFTTKKDEI